MAASRPSTLRLEYAFRAGHDGTGKALVDYVVALGYSALLKQTEMAAAR